MNSDPNSDCEQCTESKLGCVHSAHTQNPCRERTLCVVPRSWALLRAHQADRARMRAWSSAGVRRSRACWACAGRNTPRQPVPGHDLKTGSRLRFPYQPQARSRLPFRVATSWTTKPGRDANPMSRPPFRPAKLIRSRPPKWGRNFNSQQASSRRQFHVATSFPA